MNNITRLHQGPYPTPEPGIKHDALPGRFEALPDSVKTKVLLAVAGTAVAAASIFAGVSALSKDQANKVPAHAEHLDPNQGENPSGILTSGAESE